MLRTYRRQQARLYVPPLVQPVRNLIQVPADLPQLVPQARKLRAFHGWPFRRSRLRGVLPENQNPHITRHA